ncbi:hypothetical protein [Dysgonomonas gadei]|uniref:Uncharacterized protein n=1 Tax=Dysgonomonas gadei ATCC BAA-286 TaxID=742766 RepID=F5J3Y1_9BACT|nr:hypothetical protein [Dysgonomonas gadei]EGJ99552.1 hypothetical protein HMPREF9455_04048 [Dysgonomonas gadei ATCC BAA-286]
MKYPFLIYLKNKTSQEYEYKRDISAVTRTDNGYSITFSNGRSYSYGADKVKYYPFISTCENVRIYENGKLNKTYNIVDKCGPYLIFRDSDNCSYSVKENGDIEIYNIKKDIVQAESVIDYFKEIPKRTGEVSFDILSEHLVHN